ncbi:MAG TPA: FTR1 family protein [Alphaproteobacteria bacterium]|nr:FTR1 family protein [Alphaproteobacteria bacterium]USO05506.1 MAG: FTR1 family protein [Rhodospirillales bacterium]HOO82257.1 FTR1 family protein [Alphaproteobacteria bacterium]
MFPTATIVFREIIEVALVVSIVLAATRGMPSRIHLVLAGLGVGVFGSVVIAFFTDAISQAIDGIGQEIFNAGVMFIAVGFLSWTVIWMKTHGRQLAQNIKAVGADVMAGDKSAYVLVGVVALATFREGAEIALFTYGMTASGAFPLSAIVMGGILGTIGGAAIGLMLYMGLLKAAQKHLFSITGWMLIVLTAGMAAQGANFLIAAGVLPPLHPEVWDTSALISGQSFIGETLRVLVGYTPRPTGMELVFYGTVLLGVGTAYKRVGKPVSSHRKALPLVAAE